MKKRYMLRHNLWSEHIVSIERGAILEHLMTFDNGTKMLQDKNGTNWIVKCEDLVLIPELNFDEPFAGLDWIDELKMDAVAYWCPECGTIVFTPTENLFYGVEQPQDCPLCETPMWVHPPKGE